MIAYCVDGQITRGGKMMGDGVYEEVCATLSAYGQGHAVAYAVNENQRGHVYLEPETAFALATGGGQPTDSN